MNSKHPKNKYACEICYISFSKKENRDMHMRTHTGEKPFSCNVCDKRFVHSGDRNKHLRTHSGDKPFSCKVCGKCFSQSNDCNRHMKTHLAERFPCSVCSKSFSRADSRNSHMRTHIKVNDTRNERKFSKEKKFSCTFCEKLFSQKGNRDMHVRIHTGDRPFSCNICAKSFILRQRLNNHLRIHTGEKPYRCDVCNKSFSTSKNINRHRKIHSKSLKPFVQDTQLRYTTKGVFVKLKKLSLFVIKKLTNPGEAINSLASDELEHSTVDNNYMDPVSESWDPLAIDKIDIKHNIIEEYNKSSSIPDIDVDSSDSHDNGYVDAEHKINDDYKELEEFDIDQQLVADTVESGNLVIKHKIKVDVIEPVNKPNSDIQKQVNTKKIKHAMLKELNTNETFINGIENNLDINDYKDIKHDIEELVVNNSSDNHNILLIENNIIEDSNLEVLFCNQ